MLRLVFSKQHDENKLLTSTLMEFSLFQQQMKINSFFILVHSHKTYCLSLIAKLAFKTLVIFQPQLLNLSFF